MKPRRLHARLWLTIVAGAWSAVPANAEFVHGFSEQATSEQLALERRFAANLEASRLRESMRELSARPHHTGSPGGRAVAESIAASFRSSGFDTRIETFYALMPTPKDRVVEMLAPREYRARLAPPAVPGEASNEVSLPPSGPSTSSGKVTDEL